jgi:hypothetical protein
MPPQAVKLLAKLVLDVLGGAGAHVAKTIIEEEQRALEKRDRFLESFKTIVSAASAEQSEGEAA